ncbi:hypothetical protein EV183_005139 [Coemansia sp. RSA 2336]|nr:hypothetical protein EV183_005139 [Coemansia sp. RSA 2336]
MFNSGGRLADVDDQLLPELTLLSRYYIFTEKVQREAPAVIESASPPANWPTDGTIEFQSYSMRYRPDNELVLKNLSFSIGRREKIGIVGRTGAGKSSLTHALMRTVEADSGRIIIDGIDISTIGLYDLRSRIGIIPQDPALFFGSIRDNLDPMHEYSDDEIWAAIKAARIEHLLEKPTEKYVEEPEDDYDKNNGIWLEGTGLDKWVRYEGRNFSVGERQLVSLCRALLWKRQILILDEATANVDNKTDQTIQAVLRQEFKDCTVLTIAHRLDTIMDCDRILVMDQGTVVEFDTPQRLMAQDGHFSRLLESMRLNQEQSNALSVHEAKFDHSISESETDATPMESLAPLDYDSGSLNPSEDSEQMDSLAKEKSSYSPPPDGGYGWVVVVCCFLLEFFAEGPTSAFGVFQDYYVNDKFKGRVSNSTISLIGVFNSSSMSILGVVSGKLSLTFLPAAVVPSQWFERHRGLATGTVNLGIGVGGIVWTQFNHLLIKKISVAWVLRLTSIIVLALCSVSLLLIKTFQPTSTRQTTSWRSLRNRNLLTFMAASFFTGVSSLIPFFYLPGYAKDVGISANNGALITSIANAASLVGRLLATMFSDYFGPVVVLLCAYTLTSSGILAIWTSTRNFSGTMAFGIIYGLGYGAIFTQTSAFVAKYFGVDKLPVFVGLYYTFSGLGFLFGPPIAGILLEKTQSWGSPYIGLELYCGLPMVIALVAIVAVKMNTRQA